MKFTIPPVPQAYFPVALILGLAIGYALATGFDGQAVKVTVTVPTQESVDLPTAPTAETPLRADLPTPATPD